MLEGWREKTTSHPPHMEGRKGGKEGGRLGRVGRLSPALPRPALLQSWGV